MLNLSYSPFQTDHSTLIIPYATCRTSSGSILPDWPYAPHRVHQPGAGFWRVGSDDRFGEPMHGRLRQLLTIRMHSMHKPAPVKVVTWDSRCKAHQVCLCRPYQQLKTLHQIIMCQIITVGLWLLLMDTIIIRRNFIISLPICIQMPRITKAERTKPIRNRVLRTAL